MSALLRPLGDEIAAVYGEYKTKREIKKILKGDKLDILCSDGLNYHVEVKEISASIGKLHFRHWSNKYDYVGSLDVLYLATQGIFSEGISAQNTYPMLVKRESVGDKPKTASSSKPNSLNVTVDRNFPSGTRYPEDFLSKPRSSSSRKRITEEIEDFDGRKRNKRLFAEGSGMVSSDAYGDKDDTEKEGVSCPQKNPDESLLFEGESKSLQSLQQSSNSDSNCKANHPILYSIPLHRLISSDIKIPNDAATKSTNFLEETEKQSSDGSLKGSKLSNNTETSATVKHINSNPSSDSNLDLKKQTIFRISNSSGKDIAVPDSFIPVSSVLPTSISSTFQSTQQQDSRVIPAYQYQVQRTAHLRYLREVIAIEKSILDTGRAIDIVSNHPIVFQKIQTSNSKNDEEASFTAAQLRELLNARCGIDKVIQHILLTL
jgi:hypothetical protein